MSSNKTLDYFSRFLDKHEVLNLREKTVIARRLRSVTLEKIGKKYNLTEGRIRQIEKAALSKLNSKWQQLQLFK